MAGHETKKLFLQLANSMKAIDSACADYDRFNKQREFLKGGIVDWQRNVDAAGLGRVGNVAIADREFRKAAGQENVSEQELEAFAEMKKDILARCRKLAAEQEKSFDDLTAAAKDLSVIYSKLFAKLKKLNGKIIKGPSVATKINKVMEALEKIYNSLVFLEKDMSVPVTKVKDPSTITAKSLLEKD